MPRTTDEIAAVADDQIGYWLTERFDARNAAIAISPERREEILAPVAGETDPRARFRHEKGLEDGARRRLVEAVLADVRRRDDMGDAGWAQMRETDCAVAPSDVSSFRLGHATLVGLIGYDYDGCADPKAGVGSVEAVASLIDELAEMAAYAYANVPSRYFPLEFSDGLWITRDVMADSSQATGLVAAPVSSLCLSPEEAADEGADAESLRTLMAAEWWGRFLDARADELERGLVVPLPTMFSAATAGTDEDAPGMDGGVMLACADVMRLWDERRDDVDAWEREGGTDALRALCSVVDDIVARIDSKVMLTGLATAKAEDGE